MAVVLAERSIDDEIEGAARPALCVDLDGSLLLTDTLHESLLGLVAAQPASFLRLVPKALGSKARFKRDVAARIELDPALLPYNPEVVEYLRREHQSGRRIALFSAADQSIVDGVAAHLGLFEFARGSDGETNLSGDRKLKAIRERYGDDFAYLGDADVDLPIWASAKASLVAGGSRLQQKAAALAPMEAAFERSGSAFKAWRKELRLHQWAKNALIFAPVVLAGPLADPLDFVKGAFAFLVFGLLASTGYILNDLLDLPADRRHPSKSARPFAAGLLTPKAGIVGGGLMFTVAAIAALILGPAFALVAFGYFIGTLSYSFKLKRVPMLDVLVLGGLFTVRVVAGTTLTAAPFSFWLITFSIFLFLSLAIVKRYAELTDPMTDHSSLSSSRGYSTVDLPLLLPFGIGSALAATMIFVIYLVEEQFQAAIYANPGWLWLIFPILTFWLMRIWRLAVHGKMDQDPVLFAVKDKVSLALGGLVGICVLMAM